MYQLTWSLGTYFFGYVQFQDRYVGDKHIRLDFLQEIRFHTHTQNRVLSAPLLPQQEMSNIGLQLELIVHDF